ncbi:hypothetical protein AALO_G00250740 [Alosa alosa]|uniref:Uncharacterized protein n=1 Tax=Alosa alosa TaxID=278164 RepID=A0AAV6FY50_9TELE|nr:hypothetical protein AALO_G00250740 [Alosa alosa]
MTWLKGARKVSALTATQWTRVEVLIESFKNKRVVLIRVISAKAFSFDCWDSCVTKLYCNPEALLVAPLHFRSQSQFNRGCVLHPPGQATCGFPLSRCLSNKCVTFIQDKERDTQRYKAKLIRLLGSKLAVTFSERNLDSRMLLEL